MRLPVFMKTTLVIAMTIIVMSAKATIFYVDASTTSSTQNGTVANPWKTLSQVNSNMSSFNPGDFILFKRGGTYSGTLTVSRSGTAGSPITFGAYGTGNKPKFIGTGSTINTLFYLYNRAYITFRDWAITDPTIDNNDRSIDAKIQRAFTFDGSSNNCKIIACDIELAGVGAYWVGGSNTMDSCDVGNLRMVVDTDQGYQPGNDDDYGANPLVISSANNTVTHNNFHDCWAVSFDYTFDGGAVEFYGANTNNNFIGYNTMTDCLIISEITGNSSNNTFVYNKLVNNGALFYFQSGATYSGYNFYNNVVVENVAPRVPESRLIGGSITTGAVIMKNNIFQLSNGTDVASSGNGLVHEDNIFKLSNNSLLGFTLNTSELSTSAQIFTNTTPADPVAWNFLPVATSPAIDFGQNVGLAKDFVGNPVPAVPNSGILEAAAPVSTLGATATAGTINCNGGTTTVTVAGNGGTAPYTGTGTFTVSAGTYTYTVTDATGAIKSVTITVSQPTPVSITVSTGTIAAPGGATTVSVNATGGGSSSYTYSLNGGNYQVSSSFSNVPAGNHSVSVKDGNGCINVKNFTITEPAANPLSASATAGNISCNGGTTSITVSAVGGTAPYTGTGTFTVGAGIHSYTITDANGNTQNATVTVNEPSAINATVSAGTISVFGGSTNISVISNGGTGAHTYRLNNGSYQSSGTFTNVTAGSHTITVKDANGCTEVSNITISQPAANPLGASAAAGSISCNGGTTTVTVSASGGVAPYTGAGTFTVGAGTYTYTVSDANGSSQTTTVTVSEPSAVTATITTGNIIVFGGTTSISIASSGGTGAHTYRLNAGSYQSSNVFNNVSAGTHAIRVKDANGCVIVRNVTITEPGSALSATATAGAISCNGGTTIVTVTGSGGTAPYTGTGNFTVGAGTYDYTITDANGVTQTTSVTVSEPAAITISATAPAITVFGGTTTVTASASGGTGSYTYKLDNGAYQASGTFNNVTAGNHTVGIKDANGCTGVKNITITQPGSALSAASSASGSITCNGGTTTVTVSAAGGTAPYTGTGTFTVGAGTHNYTVTDANGVSQVTSVTLTEPAAISMTATAGVITTFGGTTSVTVSASGGTGTLTYKLNNGAYQASNIFNNIAAGTYTVIVKDANGCTKSGSLTITQPSVNPLVVTATAGSILCNGSTATVIVSATGGTAPYTGTGTFNAAAGTYNYSVTDANGTTQVTSVTVSQPAAINVAVSVASDISIYGGTTSVSVTATGGAGNYTYRLNNGNAQASPTFRAVGVGNHTMTVTDGNGCAKVQAFAINQSETASFKVVMVSKSDVTCRGASNGAMEVIAMGGRAPYTYKVENGRYSINNRFSSLGAGIYRVYAMDANGNVASTVIVINDGRRRCGGTGRSANSISINTFPNPSAREFSMLLDSETEEDIIVEVMDMFGKKVYQAKGTFDKKYQFGENFKAGTYFVRVIQGTKVTTQKIIKL